LKLLPEPDDETLELRALAWLFSWKLSVDEAELVEGVMEVLHAVGDGRAETRRGPPWVASNAAFIALW